MIWSEKVRCSSKIKPRLPAEWVVRLFVFCAWKSWKWLNKSSNVFPHQTVWQYSNGDRRKALNAVSMKKSQFSIISLYLGNDTRQSHRYNGRRIGKVLKLVPFESLVMVSYLRQNADVCGTDGQTKFLQQHTPRYAGHRAVKM